MKKPIMILCGSLSLYCAQSLAGGPVCTPNNSTSFQDFLNRAYTIGSDAMGDNTLTSQCTNLTDQQVLGTLDNCGVLDNPINGLGLSPVDKFLYGMSPTDNRGIGTHLEMTFPFPAPGQPGDIMKADEVDVYRIGNDGGYQNIGFISPPTETATGDPNVHQVVPIVHSASTFNQAGDMFMLAYRTNYESSANIMAGTGDVNYQAPQIVIGHVPSATLIAANNGANNLNAVWTDVDDSSDPVCAAVVNEFRNQTNAFSDCVVSDFIANGNHDAAVDACLAVTDASGTTIMDRGIHDFAVSPSNGHFYAYDSQTYSDKDVLIEVDPDANPMEASCTEYADAGNGTRRLTSLMFSQQNKLVALFADANTGVWIDTSNGDINPLATPVADFPHGDGSSLPFDMLRHAFGATVADLIFKNGFEDFIFANGFEGDPVPPTCPAF
ncbi:hypothetical protein [Marinicella rhabdoformis]|uniref:hypothetical protein n=1 Tax=Marinicella rhabdoformis TaxID=2580566 RepID=UPI0012AECC8B|nr:hypothetical protein [Marinicella rhabdoformis]